VISGATGAIGALAALAFVATVNGAQTVLWPDELSPEAFAGSWRTVLIPAVAGLSVGLVHTFIRSAQEQNVFVALSTGAIDRRPIPGAVLIALLALAGGFSLGPEVPTGLAAAGVAAWWAHRQAASEAGSDQGIRAAITGAWAGLFTAPVVAALLSVELGFDTRVIRWRAFAGDAVAAIAGFSVFFSVQSGWSATLRLLQLAPYTLELWHLLVAVALGMGGAVLATLFKVSVLATRRLAAPLEDRPMIRSLLAGVAMGLIGFALPLTLFLGTEGLVQVTENPAALGMGLILVSVVAKLIVTSGALSFGFVGGPVFPLLFAGGGVGSAVVLAAPNVPEGLAVPALMAATAAAVIPAPLSLAALTLLIAGVNSTEAAPVFTAAFVAFIAGRLIEGRVNRRSDAPNPGST